MDMILTILTDLLYSTVLGNTGGKNYLLYDRQGKIVCTQREAILIRCEKTGSSLSSPTTVMETLLLLIGIGVLLLCIILTLFILLVYSGLFEKVEVGAGKPPIGEAVIAYKFARGPYKEAGPLFTEVCKIAPKNKCLGIYYDDPKTVRTFPVKAHYKRKLFPEDLSCSKLLY